MTLHLHHAEPAPMTEDERFAAAAAKLKEAAGLLVDAADLVVDGSESRAIEVTPKLGRIAIGYALGRIGECDHPDDLRPDELIAMAEVVE